MSDPAPTPAPTTDPAPAPDPNAAPAPDPKASDPAPTPDPKADPAPEPKTPAEADWRASLSDDLKKHAERFNSPEDLVKGHMELRQKLSKAVVPPGKDADEETVAAYRKATGVPDKAEGYKFEMPEGVDATDVDKAFQKTMAETFHGLNVSAEQAKGLNKVWNDLTEATKAAQIAEDKKFADESEAALKASWGKDFEANRDYANRAGEQMFGDDLEEFRTLETKDGRFVADHPVLLKALASIGREMGEAGIVPRLTGDAAEQAQDEINGLREKIQAAQAKGDNATANKLYQREQALLKKMSGNQGIVGSAGRAA